MQRLDKTLTDNRTEANRPYEHGARLKEVLARQARLNAALDLDQSDAQAAEAPTQSDSNLAPLRYRRGRLLQNCSETPCQPLE
jgi:hypothetical protein